MIEKKYSCFNLDQIARSGQCFRMTKLDEDWYEIIAKDKYLRAKQVENTVWFDCSKEDFEGFWKAYFDLDTDYEAFVQSVDKNDEYLSAAVSFGSGIRILRQNLWEMIVSFLISQQNNIPRIRRCISNICEKYGEKHINDYGDEFYAFPEPLALAFLDENALMECNLGYRSKYVVRTAKMVVTGECDPELISGLTYEKSREELLKLYGVGKKVAECICLFALHHIDAFPIDTHIKKVLDVHYKEGFPLDKYRGYNGVMQQYIFFYDLFGEKV